MKSALASVLLLMSLTVSSDAAYTGFEDLPVPTRYPIGSAIFSNGLSFNVVGFPDPPGQFAANRGPGFDPLETTALGTGRAALEFVLPDGANHISFDYGIGSNGAGLIINGVATPLSNSFDFLDGTTVAEVPISLQSPQSSLFHGRITLTGDIDSFTVGGIEFSLDNVKVFVPEPSCLALLLIAAAGMALKRKPCHSPDI